MLELNFTPVIIVGYWKSGTTLLQHLIARDNRIHNLFPNEICSNYDGTPFWNEYFPKNMRSSDIVPQKLFTVQKRRRIRKELNRLHDNVSPAGLLKRPQFSLNIPLLRYLFPDGKIIGIKRALLPNIYSMMRMRARNKFDGYVGLFPEGWRNMEDKPPAEQFVWQYWCANNSLDEFDISIAWYSEVCDNTAEVIESIGNHIGLELDIEIPDIINHNYEYQRGGTIQSLNLKTVEGNLSVPESKHKEMAPMSREQQKQVLQLSEKYKDSETNGIK